MENYRAYFWGNFYLSSIQQGIQASHVVGNMSYQCGDHEDYIKWSTRDKTIMLMNGGDNKCLQKLIDSLSILAGNYAWGYFSESADALNDSLTSVGIILPESVWYPSEDVIFGERMTLEKFIIRKIRDSDLAK